MRRCVPLVLVLLASATAQTVTVSQARAQTGRQSPSAGQPNLPPGAPVRPAPVPYAPPKPGSPVVQQLVGGQPLIVRKHASASHEHVSRGHAHSHHVARRGPVPFDLERPALAGVTLLQPLPPAPQPPHVVVPLPAYPLDALAASYLMPAPPIVCHRTPRVRDLPDPRLYKEATLDCEPDNP